MKGLIGRKLGMTQVYAADGRAVPVTVVDVSPSVVLQVKTLQTDGYEAIQIGYGQKKLTRARRPNQVRARAAGLDSAPVRVREFGTDDASRFVVGDRIGADFFKPGDRVKVTGTSKGHGFTGVMKRFGFGGGTRKSHGGGPAHRGAGSAGSSADPSRTMPGRRLHGQHGNKKSTVRNLTVVQVDLDENLLLIKGSVPGPANGLLRIELTGNEAREYAPARGQGDREMKHAEEAEVTDPVVEEVGDEAAEEMAEAAEAEVGVSGSDTVDAIEAEEHGKDG